MLKRTLKDVPRSVVLAWLLGSTALLLLAISLPLVIRPAPPRVDGDEVAQRVAAERTIDSLRAVATARGDSLRRLRTVSDSIAEVLLERSTETAAEAQRLASQLLEAHRAATGALEGLPGGDIARAQAMERATEAASVQASIQDTTLAPTLRPPRPSDLEVATTLQRCAEDLRQYQALELRRQQELALSEEEKADLTASYEAELAELRRRLTDAEASQQGPSRWERVIGTAKTVGIALGSAGLGVLVGLAVAP